MTIKVTKVYRDKQIGRWVAPDELLEVSDERGQQIINAGYAMEYIPDSESIEQTGRRRRQTWQSQEGQPEAE
jgi:hypothetical protein